MNTSDNQIAADAFWELTGPDGFYLGATRLPHPEQQFKDVENAIHFLLTGDTEALGKWLMNFARPALIESMQDEDIDLRQAMKNLGFDVDMFAPLSERNESVVHCPGVVLKSDIERSAVR